MSQKISGPMWRQLRQRSSRSNMSLQGQIRAMLVDAILDNTLTPDSPIPSSRELAGALGVGRITVVLAYQQLVDEGYLLSRQRRGHFVNPQMAQAHLKPHATTEQETHHKTQWRDRFHIHPSAQRSIHKPPDWQQFPFPFLYGQFDQALFPTAAWREACLKALGVLDIREWAPDQITRDDPSLVQQIRTKVLPRRGVWASADQLIITVGAQHALYMVADLLMRAQTKVAMEDPGYPDARNIFLSRTAQLEPLPLDQQGLIIDPRLVDFDYLYTTPSHQCPTGVTLPLERRQALLQLAHESNLVIIEDDFESENSFTGDPIPALKSLDQHDRVIYIGSLSKSLAPGLRIGYIVAAPELIEELRALRRLMLRHPSTFIQRALSLFISLGHNDAQLRRLAQAQKERNQILMAALAQHLPQCKVIPVSGGGACWLRLPEGINAHQCGHLAAQKGVLIETGDVFFAHPKPQDNYIRLGYQSIPASAIEQGIITLATLMRQM